MDLEVCVEREMISRAVEVCIDRVNGDYKGGKAPRMYRIRYIVYGVLCITDS